MNTMLRPRLRGGSNVTPKEGDLWIVVALFFIAINFVLPSTTLVVACLIVGFLIWRADLCLFPAILLFHFNARNFLLEDFGTEDYLYGTLEYTYMNVGGFPITVANIAAVVMTARWLNAWVFEHDQVIKQHAKLAYLWLLAAPVSLAITIVARLHYLPNPTQAIRCLLGFGVFLYGMRVARSWPLASAYFCSRLAAIAGLACLLGLFGRCGTNFFFLFMAMGPALGVALLRQRLPLSGKLVAGFALAVTLAYSIIGQPTEGETQSTITSMAQGVLSLLIGLLFVNRRPGGLFYKSYWLAGIFTVLFTAYAIQKAGNVDINSPQEGALNERIQYKVYGDRAPLWKQTWTEIRKPPYVIRKHVPIITDKGKVQVFGAHNTYLQLLNVQGWWAGGIFIVMIWCVMMNAERSVRGVTDLNLRGLYGGLFVVCTVGLTTGHSAGGGEYLFYWGSLAGVCIGAPIVALRIGETPLGSPGQLPAVR